MNFQSISSYEKGQGIKVDLKVTRDKILKMKELDGYVILTLLWGRKPCLLNHQEATLPTTWSWIAFGNIVVKVGIYANSLLPNGINLSLKRV